MSSKHLPKVISHRGRTTTEVERENFEKTQTVAINKAINNQEAPVKEKHVRTTVLGTFQDNGAGLFWSVATKLPVQGNPIVCWKFLHVLHKIFREGHKHSMHDSWRYSSHLTDLGKLWSHLREGYGRLIGGYCALLVQKLKFHKKNNHIPGSLTMSDEQFSKICGSDVNNYFEICVDMLDYMDEILNLQQHVFGSLDMSRSNSMTNSGQCRLAPLILCIQDSCQLYDYIVKSLFRLHSSLPPDTLSGHRDRFLSAYKRLKQFYLSSSNLQYFKNLVQVPFLPEEPPNFLIASDFNKHVKPVAVVPTEPEPEPELETPDTDSIGDLVDTSHPPQFAETFGNGFGPPETDERDLLIERLTREVQQLRAELERVRTEDMKIITAQKEEIAKLEKILSELRLSADKSLKENDSLKKKLEEASVHAGASVKLSESEKATKANEEKFKKMKDIYGKLREEHVNLLRTNAETTKKLEGQHKSLEEKEQLLKESHGDIQRMENERKVLQESLQQSADEVTSQLAFATSKNTELEKTEEQLEHKVKTLEEAKSSLMSQLQTVEEETSALQTKLNEANDARQHTETELSGEITTLQGQLQQIKEERDAQGAQLSQEIGDLKSKLEESVTEKKSMEQDLNQQLADLRAKLAQTVTDKESTEERLTGDINSIHSTMLAKAVEEGRGFIQDALDQFENPTHIAVKCTAEFLLMRAEPVLTCLDSLKNAHSIYSIDKKDLEALVKSITSYSHHMGDCVLHGIATTHSAQLEAGEELGNACREAGEMGLKLLDAIEAGGFVNTEVDQTAQSVKKLMHLAEALVPKMVDIKEGEIGDLVENEMSATHSAIEQAAQRIEEMLHKNRSDNSGVELQVNEGILDSCTGLMEAIKILLSKSHDLQKEIVSQGRGTSSSKEFYKKNHRWTEGLLSAAKAVGFGATTLMEAADKVVKGEGKFEELIVCSNEITASTAQLVVASKVKADRRSEKLKALSEASKRVSSSTGKVVGSAREGSQRIEEQSLMDFSKLTLHQTKKNEMQSQVRLLELEKELEQERLKLSELRRQHYQLAGESEGWEVGQDSEEAGSGDTPHDASK
ncbi:huntingtin-interacting protein 1-like isoform X2 [Mizuhopecten yessoensis]|uniref:huntingtin-interacting protein 1-like isoform X2 n=1 Tax=Mizuhopecten yessoensis TaxID=6573 RepID=UPI000B45E296|nr:huntingtin-interacting protein 1-like isoform X2 [Mizuhopecten yessoensis]